MSWWAERRDASRSDRTGLELDRRLSVTAAALEQPDAPALLVPVSTGGFEIWSWSRLADEASSVALPARGPFPFVATTGVDTVVRLLAAWQHGVPVVPLHSRWPDAERRRFLERLSIERLSIDSSPPLVPAPSSASSSVPSSAIDPDSILAVVATSGSTGPARGVALSRRAVLAAADASAANLGWQDQDRWLASLPFAHVGGLSIVLRCLAARRCTVLPPPVHRFDAATVHDWVERTGTTLLSVVPTMLRRLLAAGPPPPSLRAVLVGGAACPPSLLRAAREEAWPVVATYGLSEACAQVATESLAAPWPVPWSAHRSNGTVGSPLPGVDVRIDDDGVLHVGGPTLMSGYLPSPAPGAGLELLDGVPWLRTNDLACWDEGALRILGRADRVIVTGGENVHPQAVEAALLADPSIARAVDELVVLGVGDDTWGQRVTAVVVPRESVTPPSLDDLRGALDGHLARFQHPRALVVVEELPRLPSGKVDLQALASRVGRGDGGSTGPTRGAGRPTTARSSSS